MEFFLLTYDSYQRCYLIFFLKTGSMVDTSINSLALKFTYYDELIIHIQYSNIPGTCIHTLLRNGDPHETNGKQL